MALLPDTIFTIYQQPTEVLSLMQRASLLASLTEEAPWINHKSTLENPDGIPETGNPACYRINPLGTFVLEVWDSCEAVAVPEGDRIMRM